MMFTPGFIIVLGSVAKSAHYSLDVDIVEVFGLDVFLYSFDSSGLVSFKRGLFLVPLFT